MCKEKEDMFDEDIYVDGVPNKELLDELEQFRIDYIKQYGESIGIDYDYIDDIEFQISDKERMIVGYDKVTIVFKSGVSVEYEPLCERISYKILEDRSVIVTFNNVLMIRLDVNKVNTEAFIKKARNAGWLFYEEY